MTNFNITKVLTHNECITLNGLLQAEIVKQTKKKNSKIKKGELTLYENIRIEDIERLVKKLGTEIWKQQSW